MKKSYLLFAMILLVSGCATNMNYDYYGSNPEYKTDPAKIIITKDDITDKEYEVLGDISATASKATIFSENPTPEKVNYFLREKASRLGANAIIKAHYGTVKLGLWSWGELDGSGTAVKFVENTSGK